MCPTLCDPMDCSLPGSSIHGIFQARVLEWVAISFSRGSSQPREWTWVLPHCRQMLLPPEKAEHWRIDANKLWCWRRLSRVPWTARRSNHSILKEINPEQSLEGLTLKFQYRLPDAKEPAPWKKAWGWARLRTWGEGATGDKMVGWHHRLNKHEFEQIPGDSEGQGSLACCSLWGCKESDTTKDWPT